MAAMIKKVEINTATIKLDQFLKWATLVASGGEAKDAIKNGLIKVNGELELRRGRQLKKGDIVEFNQQGSYQVE